MNRLESIREIRSGSFTCGRCATSGGALAMHHGSPRHDPRQIRDLIACSVRINTLLLTHEEWMSLSYFCGGSSLMACWFIDNRSWKSALNLQSSPLAGKEKVFRTVRKVYLIMQMFQTDDKQDNLWTAVVRQITVLRQIFLASLPPRHLKQ